MDSGAVIQDPLELSATLMRDERAYMARWLALEVLMTDETVCEDGNCLTSSRRCRTSGSRRR